MYVVNLVLLVTGIQLCCAADLEPIAIELALPPAICPDGTPIKGTCGGFVNQPCEFPWDCLYPNGPSLGLCCDTRCEIGPPHPTAYCGLGGAPCPSGYHCKTHPTDAWAVCCRDVCPNGESHLNPSKNPCTDDDDCPYGYMCNHPNPNSENGVCCFKPCEYGSPLANWHCGRGGERCPAGYDCNIHPTDAFAVCCDNRCPNGGLPLAGAPHCGRGGERCPEGYTCAIDATDRYAVCCDTRCPGGKLPLQGVPHCGRGGERCPNGSSCNIHPTDAWAVCCEDEVDCPDDLKLCPDGSYVARDLNNNCKFFKCRNC